MIEMTASSILNRYTAIRNRFNDLPANRNGMRMNLEHMKYPEENASIGMGSSTDSDPSTHDILRLTSDGYKGNYKAETFLEIPANPGFFGWGKEPRTLAHLSRQVSHQAGGYGLSEVVLTSINLETGELLAQHNGAKAVREAQDLDSQIPFRIHTIDPIGLKRGEENLLTP